MFLLLVINLNQRCIQYLQDLLLPQYRETGGEHCPFIAKDSEPIRLLEIPTSPSLLIVLPSHVVNILPLFSSTYTISVYFVCTHDLISFALNCIVSIVAIIITGIIKRFGPSFY